MEKEGKQLADISDDQKVCSLCMQLVRSDFKYIHEEEMAPLQKFIPKMNINTINDPIICKQCFDSLSTHNSFLKSQKNDELLLDLFVKTECLDKESEIDEIEMSLKTEPIDIKSEGNEEGSNPPFSNLHEQMVENSNCKDVERAEDVCEIKQEEYDQFDFKSKWKGKASEECGNGEYKSKSKSHFTTRHKGDSDVYKCDMCNYKTKRQYFLQKHQLTHYRSETHLHGDKFDDEFKQGDSLNVYKCDTCDFKTKFKTSLSRHQLKHKDFSEVQIYKCGACDYKTKYKHHLEKHELRHKDLSEVQTYKCDACDYRTKFKSSLVSHQLKHKDFSEVPVYKCDTCDYKTKHKSSLIAHQLIHKDFSEVQMYKCDACGCRSKFKRSMIRHQLKHKDFSEVKIYKCDLCEYISKRKANLKHHMLKHKDISNG